MKKLYLIALGPSVNRESAVAQLEKVPGCGPWFYSMPGTFCIFSDRTASSLFGLLHNPADPNENLLVTEMPTGNYSGWLPQEHCRLVQENSTVHEYDLDFRGYWQEGRQEAMPVLSGIYCVYACTPQADGTLSIRKLLYVDSARDVRQRILNDDRKCLWRQFLQPGENLCYSCASLADKSHEVCKAALVYRHQPCCNEQANEGFRHGTTHIRTKGDNLHLSTEFTVYRSVSI